jgi:hypothetical protein
MFPSHVARSSRVASQPAGWIAFTIHDVTQRVLQTDGEILCYANVRLIAFISSFN